MQNDPKIQRSRLVANTLEVSLNVVSTLKEISKAAPIPFLGLLSTLALSILETVQNVRNNKDDFLRLGNEACNLVYAVARSVEEIKNPSKALFSHLRELVKTLSEIDSFAKERADRKSIYRTIFWRADAGAIQEYHQRLRHALDVFGIQTMISQTDIMNGIAENIRNMNTEIPQCQERSGSTTAASTYNNSNPSSIFSFSGSNISFSNTSFNTYDKDYHSTTTQDSSCRKNSGNTYHQVVNPTFGPSGPKQDLERSQSLYSYSPAYHTRTSSAAPPSSTSYMTSHLAKKSNNPFA